jgi:hypothetical protein
VLIRETIKMVIPGHQFSWYYSAKVRIQAFPGGPFREFPLQYGSSGARPHSRKRQRERFEAMLEEMELSNSIDPGYKQRLWEQAEEIEDEPLITPTTPRPQITLLPVIDSRERGRKRS